MSEYAGRCGCGATKVAFQSDLAPEEFQPRSDAQTCNFCRLNKGVWISDSKGSLVIHESNVTAVHTFATAEVRFHFCTTCEELAYAIYVDASDGNEVAVVRRDLFHRIASSARPVIVTNFEGQTARDAQKRRLEHWTPLAPKKVHRMTRA
jgi:hypothetical protein